MQLHDVKDDVEEQWLHDMRNGVNSAVVSSHVLRSFLERGEIDQALQFLSNLEAACERCRLLMMQMPSQHR